MCNTWLRRIEFRELFLSFSYHVESTILRRRYCWKKLFMWFRLYFIYNDTSWKKIREKFHCVPSHDIVSLFIDGTGGYGTNESINKFNKIWCLISILNLFFKFIEHHTQISLILEFGKD